MKIEPLECRTYLDATLTSRGTLVVSGGGGGDTITVNSDADQIEVTHNSATVQFPAADVKRIYIDAGGGADAVTVNVGRRSTLLGGGGNDTLSGGSAADSLDGGTGDDVLDGQAGSDTLTGGDGDDIAEYGDRARGFTFEFPAIFLTDPLALGSVRSSGEVDVMYDGFESVGGTDHQDYFQTSSYPWEATIPGSLLLVIGARGGADTYQAWEGGGGGELLGSFATIFHGGSGDDQMSSFNNSAATFFGDGGDDSLTFLDDGFISIDYDGGSEIDTVIGSGHLNASLDLRAYTNVENATDYHGTVIGDDGPNLLIAGGQNMTVLGGGGNDTIVGSDDPDYLVGGEGDDFIQGGQRDDTIFGDAGDDLIAGNAGNDKIHGGDGNDTIVGGRGGRDTLFGDAGDDFLLARDGSRDILHGGDGDDLASLDGYDVFKNDLWDEIETLL